jgi:hypothetical protein
MNILINAVLESERYPLLKYTCSVACLLLSLRHQVGKAEPKMLGVEAGGGVHSKSTGVLFRH